MSENNEPPDPEKQHQPKRRFGWTLFAPGAMFSSLRVYQFRVLWYGMLMSTAAMQMDVVARSWLAYDITGSGLAIGLVALAMGAPRFVLAPFGGVAADRFDKRFLLIVAQSVRIVLALAIGTLVLLNRIEIWHLMVAGVFQGFSASFMMPARTAFISNLVSDDELPNAIALDATGRNLNRVVAPSVAGLLIWLAPAIVYFTIACFFALAAFTILRLPAAKPEEQSNESVFRDASRGFAYVWRQKTILLLLSMSVLIVLLGMPFRSLLPVFQKDVFNVGPSALGVMYTAVGVGAIIASLLVARISDSPHKQQILLGAGVGFGLSLAAFAVSGNYLVGLSLLAVVGFASQVFLTLNKTLLMVASDRAYYGRVMSIYMMGFSLMPMALLPMGAAVDIVGAPTTVATAGVVIIAAVAISGTVQGIRKRGSDSVLVPSR